ncbi:three-Cys-motif partner protein TcmP [Sphingomonas koreensis]|nr:three-Cys-motif partner protein TcmP [Sphingomonas koreensis]
MAAQLEQYHGREQSFIKHEFLTQYLQAASYKTLQGRSPVFNFVDAFAGPWRVSDENYSDASFNQALHTLEAVRADLGRMGRSGLRIRFCFCERRPDAVDRLKAYAEKHSRFEIHVFEGAFEDNLTGIADVCHDGFTFTFIDPTGWDIRSEPVFEFLKARNGEFLLNFMAEHVNRHAGWSQVSESFGRFLADPDWKDEFAALPADMSNEERVLLLMKRKIKRMGAAMYLPDIPILKPRENRIKMRLILGTHSRKGLEVFRDVHGKVELSEIQTRNTISRSETRQLGLWSHAEESEDQQRAVGVGSASQQLAARELVSGALAHGASQFDDIAALVMEQCAMRLTNTKDLLVAMRKEGFVAFDLQGRTKKPQPETIICATEA